MTAVLKPAQEPSGLIRGLAMDRYQSHPALSRSMADYALRSPAHFKYVQENGSVETDAMKVGRRIHGALLEPREFWATTAIWSGGRRYGKEWDSFSARYTDKDILTLSEESQLLQMTDAFQRQPIAARLRGDIEASLFWKCGTTGLDLKCRPDVIGEDGYVYDLKSTFSASAESFVQSIVKWGYFRQASWYLAGVEAVTGIRPKGFIFVAIEKAPPFGIQAFELDRAFLAAGAADNARALDIIANCRRTGLWPSYGDEIKTLSMPKEQASEDGYGED